MQDYQLAKHNLDVYQKCHVIHQYRCLAHNSLYRRNQTVAVGSPAHSLSKNQLEEANRGPNHEVADHSMDGYSTDYDTEGDDDMQQVLALMPSLTALLLASFFPQPPAINNGAGLQGLQPSPLPLSTFSSALGPTLLRQNATLSVPPAIGAVQAEKATGSLKAKFSSDEDKAPPGLISPDEEDKSPGLEADMLMTWANVLMPCVDVVMPSTGLLTFSMDQLHAALDSHPQMFAATMDNGKKEDTKKEDDEHVGHDVTPDGQDEDAADEEEKGGGSGTPA